jgi:hypothetical protein
MLEIKCGDLVRVKALMACGDIDLKCKVIEYRNYNGFPRQPIFRALEDFGKIKKGQVFGGSVSEVVEILS